MEAEFASWQASIGPDFNALQSALKPIERFAIRFRTEVEPFYSIHFMNEQQALQELAMSKEQENAELFDVEEIEREKEEEEYRALAEGELLATDISKREVLKLRKWYERERILQQRERRKRVLTGAGWSLVIDPLTRIPFWYNDDTGEASYGRPKPVEEREMLLQALKNGYAAAPLGVVIHILQYLIPYPDRMNASAVCARWCEAFHQEVFLLKVLPL